MSLYARRPSFLRSGFAKIAAAVCLLAVAACGPVYDTQHFFTPPADASGRQMTTQCRMTQNMCKQNCQLQESVCRSDARARGMMEYHAYVEKRRREKAPIKRSPESFVSDYGCSADRCEAACEEDYRACYVEAGGQVRSKQVCVAFCDQQGKK